MQQRLPLHPTVREIKHVSQHTQFFCIHPFYPPTHSLAPFYPRDIASTGIAIPAVVILLALSMYAVTTTGARPGSNVAKDL
jgi:hypothetical protein